VTHELNAPSRDHFVHKPTTLDTHAFANANLPLLAFASAIAGRKLGVAPNRGTAASLGRLPVGRENPMRGKTRPPYDPEFRKRAVQLVVTQGLSKQQVADDLGCSYESLRNWVKQHEIDEGKRQGPSTAELDELRSLRRENKILREEREILRKAAAFFARETM